MNDPRVPTPSKFVQIAAVAPNMVYLLDDQGNIWARFERSAGDWVWGWVEPPPFAAPAHGIRPVEGAPTVPTQEQKWKPFGSEP